MPYHAAHSIVPSPNPNDSEWVLLHFCYPLSENRAPGSQRVGHGSFKTHSLSFARKPLLQFSFLSVGAGSMMTHYRFGW